MHLAGHARALAFVVLAAVTAYGVFAFATGDWYRVVGYWEAKLPALPLIFALVCVDVAAEGVSWTWVYERLGIRAWDAGGARAYLAGRAGLLLPAQLGRLIRPDSMVRLGRGSLRQCLTAEAASFVLDATSVAALLVGLIAYRWQPLAAPVAAVAVVGLVVGVGDVLAARLSGTRLELPVGFWWRWQTFTVTGIQMLGWAAHGTALYVMLRGMPGDIGLWDSLFYSAASSVGGVATGLPGGIGATEGLLGAFLRIAQVPAAHLALAVGAFRILSFWIWIPLGWLALASLRRRVASADEPDAEPTRQIAT